MVCWFLLLFVVFGSRTPIKTKNQRINDYVEGRMEESRKRQTYSEERMIELAKPRARNVTEKFTERMKKEQERRMKQSVKRLQAKASSDVPATLKNVNLRKATMDSGVPKPNESANNESQVVQMNETLDEAKEEKLSLPDVVVNPNFTKAAINKVTSKKELISSESVNKDSAMQNKENDTVAASNQSEDQDLKATGKPNQIYAPTLSKLVYKDLKEALDSNGNDGSTVSKLVNKNMRGPTNGTEKPGRLEEADNAFA
jgi:hypothetical protein